MTKRLFARGSDGTVCIVEGGSQDYIDNPSYNLDKVHFHSALSYMRIPTIYVGSVSFPLRTVKIGTEESKGKTTSWYDPVYGEVIYPLVQHNLGFKPAVLVVDTADALSGNYPIQQSGLSMRNATVVIDEQTISLQEKFVTYDYDLTALTRNYKIYIFQEPI